MLPFGDLAEGQLFRVGGSVVTLGSVAAGLALFVVACLLSHLVGSFLKKVRRRGVHDVSSVYVLEKVLTYGLIVIGAVAGLSTAGLDLSSFSLFAGATGIGIGLGLQGVVKEFVSGLILVFDPTVSVGDYVEVEGGAKGVIVEIGPRATRIRTNDNLHILIPNSHLIERPLTNTTLRGDTRRIHIPFSVNYGCDRALVRDAVLAAARASPFTLPENPLRKSQVWLVSFGDSGLNFELLVWPTPDAVKRPAAMLAAYNWAIADALRAVRIGPPVPQAELRIRSVFGKEGDEALALVGARQSRRSRRAGAASAEVFAASVNDAADDLLSPDHEPDEPAPARSPPPQT
ncbi:mechanosensitive ion channel family protein [Brevundimonas sp. Root1279]|uniref:mechanosensitive ion channel family protein n=1 Tax=Brevundimonas sp. Root1279 TaxID=1736443 RepID=UPI0006FABA3B|nr:mechanosensitive ion channel domain-containing protein [Brevundimonas sp. Root1279]KQW82442.1 transporter [Brevundimonas sp. Root1279]